MKGRKKGLFSSPRRLKQQAHKYHKKSEIKAQTQRTIPNHQDLNGVRATERIMCCGGGWGEGVRLGDYHSLTAH